MKTKDEDGFGFNKFQGYGSGAEDGPALFIIQIIHIFIQTCAFVSLRINP